MNTRSTGRVACIAVLCAGSMLGATANSQPFPAKPVRLVIGFTPGGSADIVGRLFGPKLNELLGQPIVYENRSGAGGTIAANIVAKSNPDGYTLLVGSSSNIIVPLVYKNLPYKEKELTAISFLAAVPVLIAVNPGVEAKSLKELIALAKESPGKLAYASASSGSSSHIAAEMFKLMTNTDLLHVPYQGSAQSLPDVVSGRISVSFYNIPTVLPFVKNGRLRPLAVAAPTRFPLLPDVMTTAEAGLAGYNVSVWFALFAPSETPQPVVNKIRAAVLQARESPEFREKLLVQISADEMDIKKQSDLARFVHDESAKFAKVVKAAAVKLE